MAVEASVQSICGNTGPEYKAKIRSLFVNLKDKNNPSLRENVVSGDISVDKFTKMTSQVGHIATEPSVSPVNPFNSLSHTLSLSPSGNGI